LTVARELSTFKSDFAKPVKGTGGIKIREMKHLKFHGKILHADAVRARSSESTMPAATSPGAKHVTCVIHAASH
jgi:hypothetical protein